MLVPIVSGGPYSRIYWALSDEYPEVWDDAEMLGTYTQLLKDADALWPTRPKFPADAKDTVLARLISAGLVIPDGRRYTIRGLDKERSVRTASASHAANARWGNADGNAGRNAETMPSLAKPSQAEPSLAVRDALGTYYDLKGGQVSQGAIDIIKEIVDAHGDDAVIRAMGAEAKVSAIDRTYLTRVKSRLVLEGERQAQAAEKARRAAEAEYQRKERERIESMPEEQRAANMARLRDELAKTGALK